MLNSYLKGGLRFVLCALLLSSTSLFGQTVIDFETTTGYTASATEGSGATDVFDRDNPNVGGNSTFIWAAEDMSLTNPTLTLAPIGVAGATSFTFSVDMLTPNTDDWDSDDELKIVYQVDGGPEQDLLWVQSKGSSFNSPASIDTDFDGTGDNGFELPALVDGFGAGVGNTFETFSSSVIALSGNSNLAITLKFFGLTAAAEGIYLDNLIITPDGGTGGPICSLTDTGLSVISCSDNTTDADDSDDVLSFNLNPTGTDLGTSGYTVSVSSGSISPAAASYGAATTFTLQAGSAGAGDVVVTITDVDNGGCSVNANITDPGACSANAVGPCFTETFENIGASSGSYLTRNWTGDEGIDFVATDASTDQSINGRAIMVRNGDLIATDIDGGIADLTVTTQRQFSGGTGTLDIIINGSSVGTVPYDETVQTTTITGIDVSGFFDIQIDCSGSDRIKIDDLMWTCFVGVPTCDILDGGLDAVTCGDGGTPEIDIDDEISFTLNPTGDLLGTTGYTVSVSSGSISPSTASYGSATTFTLQSGSAGAGDVVVTITDADNAGCDLDVTLTDPGVCSFPPPSCDLLGADLDAVTCGDSGSPVIDTDDVISFTLNPIGDVLSGSGYAVSVSSGTISPTTAAYGSATTFTLQTGSAGAGDVVVTITDADDAGCTLDVTITDPGVCSFPPTPALMFSQYVDTDSGIQPKGVEIWNNTGSTIDFSVDNLVIEKGTNGAAPSTDFTLNTGTLESGKIMVIGSDEIGTYLDATFGSGNVQYHLKAFSFNGDDALVLKLNGVITDMIGVAGTDPGSEWEGSGVSTKDQNISLLSVIEEGNPAGFADPSTRFSTTSTTPSGNGGLQGFGLAPNEATYVLTPSETAAVQCAEFEVLVSIVNGGDLNTVETYLTFDPALVQVESVTAPGGGTLPDLSTLSQVVIPATIDNIAGTIAYAASSPTLLTDNFDLMLITFSAVAGTGTSAVDVVLTGSPISRIATTGLVGGVFLATDLDVTAYTEGITLTPDLELPFFACVSGPNEEADLGTCIYTVQGLQYDPVGAEDNCGIASIINDYNNTSTLAGESLTDGTTITWTVTDVNGNFGQCTFTMTVEDTQNPVASCQGMTVQLDASGMASITPGDIDNGSTDNCGITNLSLDATDFTCANVGPNTVTLTVTDAAGNQDQCTAIVTVEDNIDPVATCQDITVQLDAAGIATIDWGRH